MGKIVWKRGLLCRLAMCMLAATMLAFLGGLTGCSVSSPGSGRIEDLDYTIVPESEIPEEFLKMLEEKKASPMQLTYLDENGLYIGVGYGTQPTSGYSIGVEAVYLAADGIHVDTTLIGPGKDELVTQVETFPYIVLKTERREEPVFFD